MLRVCGKGFERSFSPIVSYKERPTSQSLKKLTLKLLLLLALLSAQRIQTLQKLSLDEMCISDGKYTFYISALLKQTSANGGQNRHLFPVKFRSFDLDKSLCVVEFSEAYIKRTAPLRKGTKQLLICYKAPHGPASKTPSHSGLSKP